MIPRIFNVFFGISGYKEAKKESGIQRNELVASIVKTTSMTVGDINELSFPELEGIQTTRGGAEEFMEFMLANS